jgi:Phosphotransferase system, mannose/fructose-specific component IIA
MIPVLVLTHGSLADELLRAARTIDPSLDDATEALALPWDIDSEEAAARLRERLETMATGDEGVLVLTDMFGGTATNIALPLLAPGRVEVVTGVNLPMLLRLGNLRDRRLSLHEVAERAVAAGQKSIHVASDFLRTARDRGGERDAAKPRDP